MMDELMKMGFILELISEARELLGIIGEVVPYQGGERVRLG